MGRAEGAAALRVEVVYSPAPRQLDRVALVLPAGSTLGDALRASGLPQRHGLEGGAIDGGIWGRRRALDHALRDGDRVELYRPLVVEPKQARRLRQARDGTRKAKRPAKAGR